MSDLFIVDFGHDDDAQARREAEGARLRNRYVRHVVEAAHVDDATAERVVAAIFDHPAQDGRSCACGCHPQLSALHGDGMDCPCSWDDVRRECERRRFASLWTDTPAARELREQHAADEAAITEWLTGRTGVTARRTTSYAPEQWEGTVDGHSFYFRERHGVWRIELDLEPNGRFANRLVDFGEDGEPRTEPVPLTEGEVIAEGTDTELGDTPVEHLAHIVRKVRDHLWARDCDHAGALFFCPKCGTRTDVPM